MLSSHSMSSVTTRERVAFETMFGAVVLPALQMDAVYVSGPDTVPSLFELTATMSPHSDGNDLEIVGDQHAVLFRQLIAKLAVIVQWWLAWLNDPLENPNRAVPSIREGNVATDIDWSGAGPLDRTESLIVRMQQEGRTATQRDLFHAVGENHLASLPQRQELVKTCDALTSLLAARRRAGLELASDLGLATGRFMLVLVGGLDGRFARELDHRGRVLANAAKELDDEVANGVRRAVAECVSAFRARRWRRDGEDIFWSNVVWHILEGLSARLEPSRKASPSAGCSIDPAALLAELTPNDHRLRVPIGDLAILFGKSKKTIYNWAKTREGFPKVTGGDPDLLEAVKWGRANKIAMYPENSPNIKRLIESLQAEVREKEHQAMLHGEGSKHDDGAIREVDG